MSDLRRRLEGLRFDGQRLADDFITDVVEYVEQKKWPASVATHRLLGGDLAGVLLHSPDDMTAAQLRARYLALYQELPSRLWGSVERVRNYTLGRQTHENSI